MALREIEMNSQTALFIGASLTIVIVNFISKKTGIRECFGPWIRIAILIPISMLFYLFVIYVVYFVMRDDLGLLN